MTAEPRRAAPTLPEVAAKRGIQTWYQGLLVDVIVAIALVVMTDIGPGMQSWDEVATSGPFWLLLLLRSTIQAIAAWALRRWADPSGTKIQPADTL